MDNNNGQPEPQIHHVMEVEVPIGDPAVISRRHEESKRKFPDISLDSDEYVVISVRRHPFGVAGIWIASLLTFIVVASLWILLCFMSNKFGLTAAVKSNISLAAIALIALSVVSGAVGNSIYKNNKFVVTNERVIQKLMAGLFNQKKQTISLEAIEDISFSQVGLFSHLFNYGTVRLSTVGDESTYTYTMVHQPEKQTELLGDLVENAKENRGVTEEMMTLGGKLGN